MSNSMRAIATGLKKLEKSVHFWADKVEDHPNKYNTGHLKRANTDLTLFKLDYESQLAALEKYPFLGNL